MKWLCVLIFLCIFGFLFVEGERQYKTCARPRDVISGGAERNAAGIYPNDEVVLSENGTFKTKDPKNYDSEGLIYYCAAYTCGKNAFPHGFGVEIMSDIPLMQCEEHRCVNLETIKCRKTIESHACSGNNEWVAGFIERKNKTHEWLEVECCHSTENTNPLFVRSYSTSLQYSHDLVVNENNGKLISMDYIKTINKVKTISGK